MFGVTKTEAVQVEAYEVRRPRELTEEIRDLDMELEGATKNMAEFRQKFFVFSNGRLALRVEQIGDRELIEDRWRNICRVRDEIVRQRNELLSEYARPERNKGMIEDTLLFELHMQQGQHELETALVPEGDPVEKLFHDAALANIVGWDGVAHLETLSKAHQNPLALLGSSVKSEEPVGAPLAKRFRPDKAARVETSATGWITEFDERGNLLRGYLNEKESA